MEMLHSLNLYLYVVCCSEICPKYFCTCFAKTECFSCIRNAEVTN